MSIAIPFLLFLSHPIGAIQTQTPLVDYTGPKKRAAVSGFDISINELKIYSDSTPSGNSGQAGIQIDSPTEFGQGLSDVLVTALIESKRFIVLERRDLKEVDAEIALQQTDAVSEESALKKGKLLGAQILVRAALTELSYKKTAKTFGGGAIEDIQAGRATYTATCGVDIKLIDVETGQILDSLKGEGSTTNKTKFLGFTASQFSFGSSSFETSSVAKAIRQAIKNGVEKLLARTDRVPWEARIASISTDQMYLNFGADTGLKEGAVLEVFRPGKPIIDPDTKVVLGREDDEIIGKCRIRKVNPKFSIAVMTEGSGQQVADGVRLVKDK